MTVVSSPAVINLDLKILALINELQKTRSVSQAAKNLELSQAAISMTLAKLRKHFNDPLFVLTSKGMTPTPQGAEIVVTFRQAEVLMRKALEQRVVFEPSTSDRIFRLCATDIGQRRLLPVLMERLKGVAPSVRVDFRSISPTMPKMLQSGELDLAVGFIPPMGAGFCQQGLFRERFVAAARLGHPRVKDKLTIEQFQAEIHIAAASAGTGHGAVTKLLEKTQISRRIGLRVPSFLGIAPVLESTDMVAILPEQLGLIHERMYKIKLFDLPFATPTYLIRQHWHERYTQDPSNRWLRRLISTIYSELQLETQDGSEKKSKSRNNSNL